MQINKFVKNVFCESESENRGRSGEQDLVNIRMVYLGEKPNLFQIIIIRRARAY